MSPRLISDDFCFAVSLRRHLLKRLSNLSEQSTATASACSKKCLPSLKKAFRKSGSPLLHPYDILQGKSYP